MSSTISFLISIFLFQKIAFTLSSKSFITCFILIIMVFTFKNSFFFSKCFFFRATVLILQRDTLKNSSNIPIGRLNRNFILSSLLPSLFFLWHQFFFFFFYHLGPPVCCLFPFKVWCSSVTLHIYTPKELISTGSSFLCSCVGLICGLDGLGGNWEASVLSSVISVTSPLLRKETTPSFPLLDSSPPQNPRSQPIQQLSKSTPIV